MDHWSGKANRASCASNVCITSPPRFAGQAKPTPYGRGRLVGAVSSLSVAGADPANPEGIEQDSPGLPRERLPRDNGRALLCQP